VLFVLGNEDADLIQKIKGASFAYEQFDDIKKLFYYTRNAKCVIGNDSAWLHAACVQGTPNVMIVGPSPFIVCHTNDITLHKTVYKKAECAPCKVWQYKCPNKHICMKSIEVEDVFRWPDLVSSVMVKYPFAWLLFIPFILITSYVFLNLVIGIIVTTMQDINLKKNSTIKKELDTIRELREELQSLSLQVDAISKMLNKNNTKDDGDEQ